MKKKIIGYGLMFIMAVILFWNVDGDGVKRTEANFANAPVVSARKGIPCGPVVTSVSLWDLRRLYYPVPAMAVSKGEAFSGPAQAVKRLFGEGENMAGLQQQPGDGMDSAVQPAEMPSGAEGLADVPIVNGARKLAGTADMSQELAVMPSEKPEELAVAPLDMPGAEEPAAVLTETPEEAVAPTEAPEGAAESTGTPEGAAGPTETPEGTAAPTGTPEGTAAPTGTPEGTAAPTGTPEETAVPTETPGVTAEPTASPSASPTPTVKPTPKPTVKPTPTPDMNLKVKQKKNNITVSWKGGNGAVYYKVWKKSPGKGFRSVKKLKKKKYTLTVPTAAANTVKVAAYNKKGKKLAESEKVRIIIPAKLSSVSCTYWGNNKVKLSWPKSRKADSYRIYRKTANEKGYHLLNTSKKLTWTDEKVKRKTIYQYKIVPIKVCDKLAFVGETSAKKKFSHQKIVATGRQKYSYQEMSEDIKELQKKFPSQLHYEVIGYSEDGRAIYDVIVGNQSASRSLLVVSSIHAREYMTSLLSMNQIEYYLENYHEELEIEEDGEKKKQKLSQAFSKIAIHYVTMANPDGVMISQKGFSAIRDKSLRKKLKNMAKGFDTQLWKANARGVDLNRNFAVSFKKSGEAGPMGYSGKKANSEKESQAIVSLLNKLKGKGLQGAVNYHATGSIIFGGGPYTDDAQQEKTTQMYDLAREITGYGSSASYESQTGSGNGLREFIMIKKKVPSITLEIGKLACPNPISEFKRIWGENKDLVLREALLFLP